jgi:hypothetical protein
VRTPRINSLLSEETFEEVRHGVFSRRTAPDTILPSCPSGMVALRRQRSEILQDLCKVFAVEREDLLFQILSGKKEVVAKAVSLPACPHHLEQLRRLGFLGSPQWSQKCSSAT